MNALRLARLYARVAPTERGGFRLARLARRTLPRSGWKGLFDDGRGNALDLDLGTYPDVAMAAGLYERDTDRLLARLLPEGGHFVDGGANLGYFTCRLAAKARRIDAFEPDPRNRARLVENVHRNGHATVVRVHAAALSDHPGTLTLHHPVGGDRNHGETSQFASGNGTTSAYEVPCVRLDEAVDTVPDVVKLDLEGGELAAVGGMTRWLTCKHAPAVVVEHNPPTAGRAGARAGDVWRAFLEADPRWRCLRVRSWALGHLTRIASPETLDGLGRQCNLLFRRART